MSDATPRGLLTDAIFPIALFCSDCGSLLRIKSGSAQIKPDLQDRIDRQLSPGAMRITIQPCQNCIAEKTRSAKDLCKAISDIMKDAGHD